MSQYHEDNAMVDNTEQDMPQAYEMNEEHESEEDGDNDEELDGVEELRKKVKKLKKRLQDSKVEAEENWELYDAARLEGEALAEVENDAQEARRELARAENKIVKLKSDNTTLGHEHQLAAMKAGYEKHIQEIRRAHTIEIAIKDATIAARDEGIASKDEQLAESKMLNDLLSLRPPRDTQTTSVDGLELVLRGPRLGENELERKAEELEADTGNLGASNARQTKQARGTRKADKLKQLAQL